MESELLQNDVTKNTAEDVLLHYLDKLDSVARLEICGVYHQREIEPDRETAKDPKVIDILHVFGRTRGKPHVYYYRRRLDSSRWTPWEKVDLDIEGDHLVPVLWNRRLYLIWPVFTQAPEEDEPLIPNANEKGSPPKKIYKIQMAWSEYKDKKWSARTISEESLKTNSALFHLGPDIYQFKAFRNRPFVISMFFSDIIVYAWHKADFIFGGCGGTVKIIEDPNFPYEPFAVSPKGTQFKDMHIISQENPKELHLQAFPQYPFHSMDVWNYWRDRPTLGNTPTEFRLLPEHDDLEFDSDLQVSFFQDDIRTFFISPEEVEVKLDAANRTSPQIVDAVSSLYYSNPVQIRSLEHTDPIVNALDPPVFESSYPFEFIRGNQHMQTSQNTPTVTLTPGDNASIMYMTGYRLEKKYYFQTYYHPYVCKFIEILNQHGIDGLMQRTNQVNWNNKDYFAGMYSPEKYNLVKNSKFYPIDDVDFSYTGSYSLYNWELFFHAPLLIASRLSKNQRFEEAQEWFHYIFDPTDSSALPTPQRYWRTRPFFETSASDYEKQQIQNLLELIASGSNDPDLESSSKGVASSSIQSSRNRPIAYHSLPKNCSYEIP